MLDDILPRDIFALSSPHSDLPFPEELTCHFYRNSRSRPRRNSEQVTRTGCVQKLVVPGHTTDGIEVNAFKPAGLDLSATPGHLHSKTVPWCFLPSAQWQTAASRKPLPHSADVQRSRC